MYMCVKKGLDVCRPPFLTKTGSCKGLFTPTVTNTTLSDISTQSRDSYWSQCRCQYRCRQCQRAQVCPYPGSTALPSVSPVNTEAQLLICCLLHSRARNILLKRQTNYNIKQDCIPVGCVPPARWPYLSACSVPGGLCPGGSLSWGVSVPGGLCPRGVSAGGVSVPGGSLSRGGVCLGGVCPGGHVACKACWDTPPCEQNSWQTPMKILPCPKLRLREGKKVN